MKPFTEPSAKKNLLPALLRRFGVWRVTIASALLATIASMFIASVFMHLLEGEVSLVGLLLSGIIPLMIAPISLYNNFNLVHRLDNAEEQLRLLSHTDELTGVFNRRYFFEQAAREFERSKRHNHQFSVAILDFDNFKEINDMYSHLAGDAALMHVAQVCVSELRHIDTFARYGGDEFIFLLPDTNARQAKECLDRILEQVNASSVHYGGHAISIRASIGVSMFREAMTDLNDLMREADFALYAAKHQGGMRVIAHRTLTEA